MLAYAKYWPAGVHRQQLTDLLIRTHRFCSTSHKTLSHIIVHASVLGGYAVSLGLPLHIFMYSTNLQAAHHMFPFLVVLGHNSTPSIGGQSAIIKTSSSVQ